MNANEFYPQNNFVYWWFILQIIFLTGKLSFWSKFLFENILNMGAVELLLIDLFIFWHNYFKRRRWHNRPMHLIVRIEFFFNSWQIAKAIQLVFPTRSWSIYLSIGWSITEFSPTFLPRIFHLMIFFFNSAISDMLYIACVYNRFLKCAFACATRCKKL